MLSDLLKVPREQCEDIQGLECPQKMSPVDLSTNFSESLLNVIYRTLTESLGNKVGTYIFERIIRLDRVWGCWFVFSLRRRI